jgi:hypothetical protein
VSLRCLVRARDGRRCRFPGCAEARHTEIHHLVPRFEGGPNTAAHLVTLCWFHQRLVHEGHWTLTRGDDGAYSTTAPDGRTFAGTATNCGSTAAPVGPADPGIAARNHAAGIPIDANTIIPMWGGERLDLGWAVTSLWYGTDPDRLLTDFRQRGDTTIRNG